MSAGLVDVVIVYIHRVSGELYDTLLRAVV